MSDPADLAILNASSGEAVPPAVASRDSAPAAPASVPLSDAPAEAASEPASDPEAASLASAAPAPDAAPSSVNDPAVPELPPAVEVGSPLAAALAADTEFRTALERHPELKSSLESALARGADLEAFQQVFPSLDSARLAAEQAQALAGFDQLYFSTDPAAGQQMLQRLYHNQFLRDPDTGELLLDKDTRQPVSTGAYDRLASAYRGILFQTLDRQAREDNDAALAQALRVLRERFELDSAPASSETAPSIASPASAPAAAPDSAASPLPPSAGSGAALPPEIQARLSRLDQLEQQLAASQREQSQAFLSDLTKEVTDTVHGDIEQVLSSAALPAYLKSKVVDDVFAELNRQAAQDAAYQQRMQSLLRAAPHQSDSHARIVAAARAQARARIAPIAQKFLSQAVSGLRQEQQQRLARVNEQKKQVEVKSTGAAPSPLRRTDVERLRGAEKSLGRRLSDREILDL